MSTTHPRSRGSGTRSTTACGVASSPRSPYLGAQSHSHTIISHTWTPLQTTTEEQLLTPKHRTMTRPVSQKSLRQRFDQVRKRVLRRIPPPDLGVDADLAFAFLRFPFQLSKPIPTCPDSSRRRDERMPMSLRPRPRCSRVVTSCSASSSPSKIKRAVIVGGSSGMGKAFAKAVVSRGGSVHIGGRDIEKLEEAATQLKTLCGDAMRGAEEKSAARCSISFACIDVTNAKSVATFFDAVEDDFDALVFTAAGRAPHGPFLDLPEEDTELMLQSKFWGAYRCAKAAAPMMRSGAIVFTSGVLGRRPGVNCVPLAVANGAIEALTRSLALELGPDLRVNCLSPGFMKTERFDHMDSQKREAMLANTAASLPLKRCGDPQDAGEALYFLASSPYTTGVVLDVDGGHMVRQYVDASTDPMRQAAKTSASS